MVNGDQLKIWRFAVGTRYVIVFILNYALKLLDV